GMVHTIAPLYAVKAAGLQPLELALAGTLLELGVFLGEVPTGLFADMRGRRLCVIVGLCVIGTGIALMGAVPAFWCFALGSVLWGVGGTFISGAHQAWLADEIGDVQPIALQYLEIVLDVLEITVDDLREFVDRSRASRSHSAQESESIWREEISCGLDTREVDASRLSTGRLASTSLKASKTAPTTTGLE